MANRITIPREVYDFLMGEGPLEGVWFDELHKGLPGRFWWRGVLRSGAGWPEPAQGIETAKPPRREAGLAREGESPVGNADAPHTKSIGEHHDRD